MSTLKKPITKGVANSTPVIMQLEALECGAACLTMILSYYDKWIPLEQVRVDCGVSRDGSSAKNMVLAAKNYGLVPSAYKFEVDDIKTEATFPCIIHWNFNHFVVLKGFRGKFAYINDPGRGEVKVPMKTFDESFTGVCLMFEPGENFTPSGKKKSTFDYIKERSKGLGPIATFIILTTIISSLMEIITPGFTRVFYDNLLSGRNPEWTKGFLIFLSCFSALQILTAWLKTVGSYKINGKMTVIGSTTFMWKLLHLPVEFFSQRMIGDILSRQGSNAGIANTIVNTIAPLVINTGMMIFYFVVMIRYNVLLTLISLAATIINTAFSFYMSKKRINSTRVSLRDTSKLAGTTTAGIESIETIKSAGAEDGFFAKWAGYQATANNANIEYGKTTTYLSIVPQVVSTLSTLTITGLGIYLTMQGEFTLGMITAFQGYLAGFANPVNMLINAGQTMQEMQTEMDRIDDVMRYPDDFIYQEQEKVQAESYNKLSGNIEIINLTFGYSRLANPVIQDFNLSLKPGSSVAFVGSSGCGKSTLSKLISGLVQPWSGEILFDGKHIEEIDRSVFTGSVAVVDQNIILFEDTIRNNLKMWDETIEDFEIIMAARDAQIHEDIMHRKGGYDYVLAEGGKDFSGGQKQRMEIARVLAQDPTICILDEATSALDAKTEYNVLKAIKERGVTCIVVAHRLSTIRDCDEIVVLDKGRVVERGTHDELMKLNGFYNKLVTSD